MNSRRMTCMVGTAVVGEEFPPAVAECGKVTVKSRDSARIDGLGEAAVLWSVVAKVEFCDVEDGVFEPVLGKCQEPM